MAIIAPYFAKLVSYFSSIDNSYLSLGYWSHSPLLPLIHLLLVASVVVFLLYLFTNSRKRKEIPLETFPKVLDQSLTHAEHLTWINRILSWMFLSSSPHLTSTMEKWMQDLNLHLASQKRQVNALIYGLREGSAMPSMQEVKGVEVVGNSLHAHVLFRSTEFGFLVAIGNGGKINGMNSAKYSAIVTHFQCWYSLVLTKVDGLVGMVIKPEEKKPIFQIKMKTLSNNIPESVKPEVVAQSIQEAVLETTLYVNINIMNPKPSEPVQSESEESCNEPDDNTVTQSNGPTRSVTSGTKTVLLRQKFPDHHLHPHSAPGTPVGTPANKQNKLVDMAINLGGSYGSLNSITRTSSGRGPAKPIRYREKSLIINNILFKPEKCGDYYPLLCSLELNHPPQKKTTHLHNDSGQANLTFDLSSRSSGLKIDLQNSSSSKDSLHMLGEFSIEGNNFEKNSIVEVPVRNTTSSAVLQLQVKMKENQEPVSSLLKKSNSTSAVSSVTTSGSTGVERSKSSIEKLESLGETKVTTVTLSKSATGSPAKEAGDNDSAANQGVSFDSSSVAEAALKDLSRKTSPVHKAVISITAVHQSSNGDASSNDVINESSIDDSQSQTDSLASVPVETPTVVLTEGTLPALHKTATLPDMHSSGAKVRRTRSLVFRSSKKSKDKRPSSTVFDSEEVTSSMTSPGSTASLNRKSRKLSKLFGKKKKKLEALEDDDMRAGTSPISEGGQVAPSSENSAKVKRSRSFKKLIKSKKKTEDL